MRVKSDEKYERCVEHRDLCAFRSDDTARCPTCHCTWSHIAKILNTFGHSCEQRGMYVGVPRAKMHRLIATARGRRMLAVPD